MCRPKELNEQRNSFVYIQRSRKKNIINVEGILPSINFLLQQMMAL